MEENTGEWEDGGGADTSTIYSTYEETPRYIDEEAEAATENIRVVCRFRPENDEERSKGQKFISLRDDHTVVVHNGSIYDEEQLDFQYNKVFPDYSDTNEVYRYISNPLIADILNGYNGCLMAYGQTGSGKTYSMLGPGVDEAKGDNKISSILSGSARGLIPRIMEGIFEQVYSDPGTDSQLSACYIEIYRETLFDLLAPISKLVYNSPKKSVDYKSRLIIQEGAQGMWIKNARQVAIHSPDDVMQLMAHGNQNRVVASTKQNKESSRSHAIFIVTIRRFNSSKMTTTVSQLHLADLAGSERVDVGAQTEIRSAAVLDSEARVSEAKKINTSLFALGRVIHALSSGGKHISFRDSKLTRILQNSLGGNSKTTLLIHCTANSFNREETLSTLRFGEKTKNIKNKASAKEQLDADELMKLLNKSKEEVAKQRVYISKLENELAKTHSILSHPNFNNLLSTSPSTPSIPATTTTTTSTTTTTTTTITDDAIEDQNENNQPTTPTNSQPTTPINSSPSRPATAVAPSLQSLMLNLDPSTPRSLSSMHMPSTPQTLNVIKPVIKRPLQAFTAYETLHFMCPLTGKVFKDPVVAADGYTYERKAIVKYFKFSKKSPITRAEFDSQALIQNYTLLRQLQNIKPRLWHTHMPYMDILPHWVIHEVLALLDVVCLLRISQTSKHFHKLANNSQLWVKHAKVASNLLGNLAGGESLPDLANAPKQYYAAVYKRIPNRFKPATPAVSMNVRLVYNMPSIS